MEQLPARRTSPPELETLLTEMLCRTVTAAHSRATYRVAIRRFFEWLEQEGRTLDRAAALDYRAAMEQQQLAPATISLRMTVVRQLCREARIAGYMDADACDAITSIRVPRRNSRRTGNWLNAGDAARLVMAPPADTLRGARDRALIGVLIGCGIRRNELVELRDEQLQQREGRWCIVDMEGKGRRRRTVPMPAWCKHLVDQWTGRRNAAAAGVPPERLFVSMDNRGRLHARMTSNAVYETVTYWARRTGLDIAPHDLRRTFSLLALAGKADLHQIQLTLGHSSIQTTQRYLGDRLDLQNAPCDALGINLRPADQPAESE